MPTFLIPLHEFNPCHSPSGADGGQFCSQRGSEADVHFDTTDTTPVKTSAINIPAFPSAKVGPEELHAARQALASGRTHPPVELVKKGDRYEVYSGDALLVLARQRGWTSVPAKVIPLAPGESWPRRSG
jgi:hypothetical protein